MNGSDEKTRRLDERNEPITMEESEYLKSALKYLQGNILRGHGRAYSVHIFLRFKKDEQEGVKKWISKLADDITSAQQQLEEAKEYRRYGLPGRLFISFFLSASGYRYLLGLTPARHLDFDDEAFLRGMKTAQHRLNDLPKEAWEKEYREDIDAMILLADNNEHFLLQEVRKVINNVQPHAEIRAVEHGRVMRNAQGDNIEHFGYADGQSQPLFFQEDIDRSRQKGNRTIIWDPGAGPDLVLVPDPYGKEKDSNGKITNHCGSYLVFRKLEQNVRAYKEGEKELAKALGLTGENAKRAGALVVGRFEDGTPVALQPTAGRPTDNFTYDEDPDGEKCPLQAHIRKVNPRRKDDEYTPIPRIVRRGITYGKRWKEPKDHPSLEELPTKDVGLLFMCYQKNIAEQFEYLQFRLANDPRFSDEQSGIDPIVGQPGGIGAGQHRWPTHWADPREKHVSFDFHSFVTLKGGEYFFAPSIYFLKKIEEVLSKT